MKKIVLLFTVLTIFNTSYSQEYLNNMKFYSSNNKYSVEIRGYFYSSFYGSCQYIFYDNSHNIQWKKVFTYAGIPNISNTGDVAIPCQGKTVIIDPDGDLISEINNIYNQQGQKYPLSGDCDPTWHISPHGYSLCGNYYFMTSGNETSDKTNFYCISKSGKELWRAEFENFCPDNINTKKDLVFLDNFSGAGISMTNELYILNLQSGELLRKFDLQILNPHVKHLIIEEDGFIFYKDNLQKFDFQCEFIKHLNDEEVRDLIIKSNDYNKIVVGLDYLNRFGDINVLKNDFVRLCELTFETDKQLMKRLLTMSLETLNVKCY